MNKQKVALVLASGGARGVAHIGVIEELEKNNFEISSISGSSIGAIIGGIYAAGHLQEYKEWLLKLDKLDVFKLVDFTLSSHGFIKGIRIFDEISPFIGDVLIEDLPIPFTAIAVDVINQKEIVFKSGKLRDALRASVAIPNIIAPYKLNGLTLVDGGILNPIPLNRVQRSKDDLLVAVDLNDLNSKQKLPKLKKKAKRKNKNEIGLLLERIEIKEQWDKIFPKEKKKEKKQPGYFDIMDSSFDIMQNQICNLYIEKYKPDIIVRISKNICGTFDFHLAQKLIEFGKQEFNEALNNYDKKMIEKYRNKE